MIDSLPLLVWPRLSAEPLSILIYHRVMPAPDPLRPGEADAETFERQMAFLARQCAVLPLLEAADLLRQGKLPRRACCITFDDGYADNLTVALPILERHSLPATVFVATRYLDGGRMFNDTVIELVSRIPGAELDLRPLGLGRYALANVDARRQTVLALLTDLKYREPAERDRLVAQIVDAAGVGKLPQDLMLTTAQLEELSVRGVEIGGHTHAHTVLTTLDPTGVRNEIVSGRTRLESITGKPVRSFAYPNGRPGRDYSADHVAIIRAMGFDAAVTTAPGVARPADDPYQLPRFTPWGKATSMFALRLARNARLGRPGAIC